MVTARSASRNMHPGVVNVLLTDGSCRSVSQSMDLATWQKLGTPSGGETPDSF
jgi:hypothetical protein